MKFGLYFLLFVLHGVAQAQQVDYVTQVVRQPPGLTITNYQFSKPCGRSLTIHVPATVTFSAMPAGISALSVNHHYIRVVDAVAGSDAELITAVNVSSKTITFTPTRSHTQANCRITSATGGIQEAIVQTATTTYSSGTANPIFLACGSTRVYAKTWLGMADATSTTLIGCATLQSLIVRDSSYPSGDILYLDGAVSGNGSTILRDFGIVNADATFKSTSGYGINLYNAQNNNVLIDNVIVWDGFGGYQFYNCSFVRMRESRFMHTAAYGALYGSTVGVHVGGHSYGNIISGVSVDAQSATNRLLYGILIEGSDGLTISDTTAYGVVGLAFTGNGVDSIDDVYVNNSIFDNCSVASIRITGTAPIYTNIKIANSHINPGLWAYSGTVSTNGTTVTKTAGDAFDSRWVGMSITINAVVYTVSSVTSSTVLVLTGSAGVQAGVAYSLVSGADAVLISAAADNIQFLGNNIQLATGSGVTISPALYQGSAQRAIVIDDNIIAGNGLATTANLFGIYLAPNTTGVKIRNNTIGKMIGITGTLTYGIAIDGLADGIITGNDLRDGLNGPMSIPAGTVSDSLITNNKGVDDKTVSVNSAASILLPVYPNFTILNSVGIGAITGHWAGRQGTMIAPSGVTFTAGATIGNTITLTANKLYTWWINPADSKIYIGG